MFFIAMSWGMPSTKTTGMNFQGANLTGPRQKEIGPGDGRYPGIFSHSLIPWRSDEDFTALTVI